LMTAIDPKYGKQALKNSMEMINKERLRKELRAVEQTTERTRKKNKRAQVSRPRISVDSWYRLGDTFGCAIGLQLI
jgi:hypothetical protein